MRCLKAAFTRCWKSRRASACCVWAMVTLALDGTKILANASKHSAVSHGHAVKQMVLLAQRLATQAGRKLYAQRKQTIEPVFGIIKAAMGFRRFSLRGLAKVRIEWTLVTLAYNLKRLFHIGAGLAAA